MTGLSVSAPTQGQEFSDATKVTVTVGMCCTNHYGIN